MIVDFHSHTRESDGTLSPRELVALMERRGVGAFSITDHDTLSAYANLDCVPRARLITGIEINTTLDGSEVHVLGYRVALDHEGLNRTIADNRSARRVRIEQMVAQLRDAGYPITFEMVLAEANGAQSLGRPHVGKALIRHGHVRDIEGAFRTFLRRGKPGYVAATHITPQQAIDAIHAAGGIAVLAHPGRVEDAAIIDTLADGGLDGLEVFYPNHTAAQTEYFRSVAQRRGLVMTAGADFHDIRYHTRGVGIEVEVEEIAGFLGLVA